MKNLLSLLILLSFANVGVAQTKIPCSAGRYEKDLFSTFMKLTVPFASNKGWEGEAVSLAVDIFQPGGDSAALRPLIIFAHGGGFTQGTKEAAAFFCLQFTKKGYVTASIEYRLIPKVKSQDPQNMKHELIMAMSDFKGAIRFFRESAARGNPYKIDPDNIFIGGVSAGAITALQVGILDKNDKMSRDLAKFVAQEGGLEGNTGSTENKMFSSKIKAVINYSGSILEENWIDKTDAPIFSYHGAADKVVPIGYGIKGEGYRMYGSESIKKKADLVGLDNLLVKAPNGGHTNIYFDAAFAAYYIDFHNRLYPRMRSMICGSSSAGSSKGKRPYGLKSRI